MNMEKELQRLIDIEAIKDLKNRYARMCNDNHNYELIDTIFAPNVKWEGSPDDPWGRAVGSEAFIEQIKGFQKQMDDAWATTSPTRSSPLTTIPTHTAIGICSAPLRAAQRARVPALASWNRAIMTMTM